MCVHYVNRYTTTSSSSSYDCDTIENSNVVVMCTSTNLSVKGYLFLLRFREEDILNVNRSQDVKSPFVFEALKNGPYHVIVFPIVE